MTAIMLSVKSSDIKQVISGEKKILLAKSKPKANTPLKCYLYSKGTKSVIGEFTCNALYRFEFYWNYWNPELYVYLNDKSIEGTTKFCEDFNLDAVELGKYNNQDTCYGLHIFDLKIYDKPKELWEFKPICRHKDCLECKHSDIVANYGDFHKIFCMNNSITRPPQSWCYVED